MKYFLTLLIYLSISIYAQVKEDFSSRNLKSWSGDTGLFSASNQVLISNGPNLPSQKIYISTNSALRYETEWSFLLDLKFNPTNSNFVRVYLVSDQERLTDPLNGFFVQFGETNADTLDFYVQKGTNIKKIFTGLTAFSGNVKCAVRVISDTLGNWTFYIDSQLQGKYNYEGSVYDSSKVASRYFGIYAEYATASRYNQYSLDNISIKKIEKDTIAPHLLSHSLINDSTLRLYFSEYAYSLEFAIENNTVRNYKYDNNDSSIVDVFVNQPFEKGRSMSFNVILAKDRFGNEARNMLIEAAMPMTPFKNQLIFTELMVDESPSQGLPEREYIEIHNLSDRYLSTKNCFLQDATRTYWLPDSVLKPHTYYILCNHAASLDFTMIEQKLVLSTMPTLTNSGKTLALYHDSTLLDMVSYADSWYQDVTKRDGGWSLEKRDIDNFCLGAANWKASIAPLGGTPAMENSIAEELIDLLSPKLLHTEVISDTSIVLKFNEDVVIEGVDHSYENLDVAFIKNIAYLQGRKNELYLQTQKMDTNIVYPIKIKRLSDCTGNILAELDTVVLTLIMIKPHGILINEILFNAKSNGVEYLELYNHNDFIIDLDNLLLSKKRHGMFSSTKKIVEKSHRVAPHTLFVLTNDKTALIYEYRDVLVHNVIQIDSWPQFTDDSGTVVIHMPNGQIIDQFHYDQKYHNPLLKNNDGVALEKINKRALSNNSALWQSASEVSGFGTPTLENSQSVSSNQNHTQLSTKVISPDGDGRDDYCLINLSDIPSSRMVNIRVCDYEGRIIKTIAQNVSLSGHSQFIWDGTTDGHNKAAIGSYMLHVEHYSTGNSVAYERHTIAVFE